MSLKDWLYHTEKKLTKDKRTYLVAAAIIVLGVLQAFGIWTPPEWAWLILNGLGLGYLRAGVRKVSDAVQPPIN